PDSTPFPYTTLFRSGRRGERLVVPPGLQPAVDLAGGAARRRDEAVGVALEQVTVEPRLAVLPLETREAGEPEQVVHASRRLGEQDRKSTRLNSSHQI